MDGIVLDHSPRYRFRVDFVHDREKSGQAWAVRFHAAAAHLFDLAPVSSHDRDGKAVWEIASEAGKKCIVMGVPVTYPPTPLNGLMVTGMLTPRGAADYTYPPELSAEIAHAVGEMWSIPTRSIPKGAAKFFSMPSTIQSSGAPRPPRTCCTNTNGTSEFWSFPKPNGVPWVMVGIRRDSSPAQPGTPFSAGA